MDTNKPLLEAIDPDVMDRLISRRDAIRKGAAASTLVTAALATASVPVALAALSRDVYGQTSTRTVTDVLKFAFILENLESEFYRAVLGTSTLAAANSAFAAVRATLTAAEKAVLAQISKHEDAHVALLKAALGSSAPSITAADFDFTGGNGAGNGPFAPATSNKAFLLAATQGFEDTGVRAYKGQVQYLINDKPTLETALRIHSVEARHASKIRKLRREASTATDVLRYSGVIRGGGAGAAGAPTVTDAAVVAAFTAIYGAGASAATAPSEANTTQGGVQTTGLGGFDVNAATEAFDEPLDTADVLAIVKNFIKDDAARGLP